MSIASAITNLTNTIRGIETTKGQIKTAVNTDIDFINNEQIEQYPNLIRNAINQYKSYIPVVTGEGKQLSLNTVPLKMKEFAVLGDTFQQSYTGKNLLQISNVQDTWNDINVNITNGIITLNGTPSSNATNREIATFTATESSTYTLLPFKSATNSNIRLLYTINDGSQISDDNTPSFSLSTGDILTVKLRVSSTDSISNFQLKPMLYKGTETIDYEPYTNGPAPNPDYPQDIRVVTGNNTIVVQGYNLVDVSPYQEETKNGVTLSKDSDGNIILNGTSTSAFGWNISLPETRVLPAGTYTKSITKDSNIGSHLTVSIGYNGSSISGTAIQPSTGVTTMTLEQDTNYSQVRMYIANNTTFNNYKLSYMILSGTYTTETLPDWEPYITPVELPLNLGNMELCKIGEYKDVLFKNTINSEYYNSELDIGSWYKKNVIEKYVYDNDLTYNSTTEQLVSLLTPALNIANNLNNTQLSAISYCNMLQTKVVNYSGLNGTTASTHKIRISISTDYATTFNEAKQLCADKGLKILFVAETPTYTKITDETLINQLEEIDNLNMNDGTTVIYAENEEGLQPTLYMEAYAKAE